MDYKAKAKGLLQGLGSSRSWSQDEPDSDEDRIEAALREVAADIIAVISNGLDSDPHQWSKRPCSTCQKITDAVGREFGCIAYAKSPLHYMAYIQQAALRKTAKEG